jgi:small-conductance mechanosensitive channel
MPNGPGASHPDRFGPGQETEHVMADAETDAKPANQNELVADIDRTRAELARTIDAIAERVNPKRNVDRAMEQVRQRMEHVHQRGAQIDPLMAGAAAAAVILGVTALFVWRHHRR